ncbi:MAG: RIP metalloprotease RseP [Firmicutes bacterium]|nr:RIP metalloprotease RseP [Bacillota bacterium]
MLTAIYAIIVFCVLILAHEFGHFITAKAVGIRVNEFSLGMGPRIFHKKKGDTEYSLRCLPIGGFVRMEGEDEDSPDPRAFNNKKFPAKALVVVAGSLMNVVLAILIVAIMLTAVGFYANDLSEVRDGSPAYEAGILPGDKIKEVNGEKIRSWEDVKEIINQNGGSPVTVTILRAGDGGRETLTFTCTPVTDEVQGDLVIGVIPTVSHNFFLSLPLAVDSCGEILSDMATYLKQLFTGRGSMTDLVGPVGIVTIINQQAKLGFIYVANLMALISLNLAIINMIPFPSLDGGRLLLMIIRLFTGKKLTDDMEGKIHFIGFVLIMALAVYLVFQDVGRFILN